VFADTPKIGSAPSLITIAGIRDHHRLEPLITIPGMRKLITDLPIQSFREAVEKLQWYSLRWKIELFHKILKSGCKAEDSKLRTAERLVNLISIFCIVSWRVFWMTMLNRTAPAAPPNVALTETEMRLLDHLVPDRRPPPEPKSLSTYIIKIARLGGYLARASDPAPGRRAKFAAGRPPSASPRW
jgi:hypothetical protein